MTNPKEGGPEIITDDDILETDPVRDQKEGEPEIIADDEILEIDPVRDQVEHVLSPEEVEANKRGVTLKQWQDLLHMAEAMGETTEWIDRTFTFNRLGQIIVPTSLSFKNCTNLTRLPEGLEVWWGCLNLVGCTGLTGLPEEFFAKLAWLSDDLQEQVKKDAQRLRKEGKIMEIMVDG